MPDPGRLLTTLQRAASAFRATPGRRGKLVELEQATEVLVAGDLHGHVGHLSRLLKLADLAAHPGRHLVVQELVHGSFRYPDGNDKSHQMLDVLAALKCQFPERVHFVLGNHELSQWTGRHVGKGDDQLNDLFVAGIHTAYGERSDDIYQAYLDLFAAAALAVRTPNCVWISHSVPDARNLPQFDVSVFAREELRPRDTTPGGSAYALTWGRDCREETVRAFLKLVDADLVITGHIPCNEGFETPNPCQLVLDSHGVPACYCLFPARSPLELVDLVKGVREF